MSDCAHRMCGVDTKETYLEILYFRQFYKHFVFVEDEEGNRKKRLEKYLEVSAVVDVGGGYKRIQLMKKLILSFSCSEFPNN